MARFRPRTQIIAWYRNHFYHRVLAYSGTWVNQQWPPNSDTTPWRLGVSRAPDFRRSAKAIRIWMEVGDRDLLNPNVMRDDMHDWVVANERMAQALSEKKYHYQFLFARNAGHTDGAVKRQALAGALEYVWQRFPAKESDGH